MQQRRFDSGRRRGSGTRGSMDTNEFLLLRNQNTCAFLRGEEKCPYATNDTISFILHFPDFPVELPFVSAVVFSLETCARHVCSAWRSDVAK